MCIGSLKWTDHRLLDLFGWTPEERRDNERYYGDGLASATPYNGAGGQSEILLEFGIFSILAKEWAEAGWAGRCTGWPYASESLITPSSHGSDVQSLGIMAT